MPPVPTALPDGPQIRQLIRDRGYTVTEFARKLGRHRESFWVMCGPRKPPTSHAFLRQIARELGVRPSDISDMPPEDDEPEALAS
jgi:hypothetical protein